MLKCEVAYSALWVCLLTFYDDHFFSNQTVKGILQSTLTQTSQVLQLSFYYIYYLLQSLYHISPSSPSSSALAKITHTSIHPLPTPSTAWHITLIRVQQWFVLFFFSLGVRVTYTETQILSIPFNAYGQMTLHATQSPIEMPNISITLGSSLMSH